MNKVYSLHDAVAKFVENGDCICFGGFTTNRKPYAAVSEILRQGQKDFTVWAGPAGGDWDMMIGEGSSKRTSTATPPTPAIPMSPVVSVLPSRRAN